MATAKVVLLITLCSGICKASTVTVNTACGEIEGTHNVSYVFRGVRYAEPPVNNKRWTEPVLISPQSKNCWSGVYDATSFGHMCVQRDVENTAKVVGYEDCLFLNIWTPTIDSNAQLDVMVFIHGGSLQVSS